MNVMEFKDYYDVLGVKRDAGFREIKIAYRNLSKRYHPDVNEGDAESKERFIEIQEAYRKLSYRYKKNKNTNNLQYDFYYSELSKTGKILPRFKLLANSTTDTFIPPAAKRSYGFIWIMLAAIAVLMFLYYKTTSYYPVQYNPAEFSGFRLPALPAKSVVSATHDTAEAANKARQEQSFSNMDSSTAQKTTAHIIDSNQLSNQKIAARVPLGNQETKRVFSPANLLSFNSHDQLVSTFGADVIKKTIYTSINGLKNKCSVLFAEPGKKIFFIWKDTVHFRMLKFIKTEEDNVNKLEKVKRSIIGK